MGRSPEVFVRPVTMTERRRLQRIGRTPRDPVKLECPAFPGQELG